MDSGPLDNQLAAFIRAKRLAHFTNAPLPPEFASALPSISAPSVPSVERPADSVEHPESGKGEEQSKKPESDREEQSMNLDPEDFIITRRDSFEYPSPVRDEEETEDETMVEEDLYCPICRDILLDPVRLPCAHKFCMKCIKSWKPPTLYDSNRCPMCRKHFLSSDLEINYRTRIDVEDYVDKQPAQIRKEYLQRKFFSSLPPISSFGGREHFPPEPPQPRTVLKRKAEEAFPTSVFSQPPSAAKSDGGKKELLPGKDEKKWNWRQNGRARNKARGCMRIYYICTEANTTNQCPAKMFRDVYDDGRVEYSYEEDHNHAAPKKLKLSPEARENAKKLLMTGMKPAQAEKKLMENTFKREGELTTANSATRAQLTRMQKHLRSKEFPTTDLLQNVVAKFGPDPGSGFVRLFQLLPTFILVAATPDGIAALIKYGDTFYIDGTFQLIQGDMIVTQVLICTPRGFMVPVAFLIAERAPSETYVLFLRSLVESSKNAWSPNFAVGDYEQALYAGVEAAFESVQYLGDLFHFLQANIRFLKKEYGADLDADLFAAVREALQILVHSEPYAQFKENLAGFEAWLEPQLPAYIRYFRKTWKGRQSIEKWAICMRPKGAPTQRAPANSSQ
jgi:hypothetical protein